MKYIYAILFMCSCVHFTRAQKIEFTLGINSGASFFRGASAASNTIIYQSDVSGLPNTAGNSYGRKPGLALGGGVAIQHISRRKFILGVAADYESLTSRMNVTGTGSRVIIPADGTVKTTHTFVGFYPYFGQRIGGKKFTADINAGLDIAIPLSAREKGSANAGNSSVMLDNQLHKPGIDLRPQLQIKLQHNRAGILLGYSVGSINYYKGFIGGSPEAYINVLRAGIFYRL